MAGRLREAENLCRQVLQARPQHAGALHSLGIIRHQAGDSEEGIRFLNQAIAADSAVALFYSNLTEMCRLAGRLDEAVAAGRKAVTLNPDYAEAHNNLGIVYYERDELDEAIACYRRAVELKPDFAQAHSNLGNALRGQKKFDEALACYERALSIAPDYAEGYNNRGTTLRELQRFDEAEAVYRKALTLRPNDTETLNNLALNMIDQDRDAEALALLDQSAAVNPGHRKTHTFRATALLNLERVDEARQAAQLAISLTPDSPEALQVMGRVAFEEGDADTAIEYYRRTIELKPDMADVHNNLGNALKEMGRLEEAEAEYEKALELQPDNYGTYVNLCDSRKFKPGDAYLALMESKLADIESKPAQSRYRLYFSLGKAYLDLNMPERAFEFLHEANALRRHEGEYAEAAAMDLFDRLINCFTPEFIQEREGHGDPSPVPILVMGMPRSGTTLVEQILASHPAVYGAGELRDLTHTVESVRGPDRRPLSFPEYLQGMDLGLLGELGRQYVSRLRKRGGDAERITDKMPSNYYFVGLLHLILPNARVIHVRRNPVDTCLSCYQRLFTHDQPHTYNMGELGRYYRRYMDLMEHWRRVLPADAMLDVDYESVVADFENQARRIIEYCRLPWDAACLKFHETSRPVKTASATQVRRPIYKSSVGRWRPYEAYLGPLLEALGPDLVK